MTMQNTKKGDTLMFHLCTGTDPHMICFTCMKEHWTLWHQHAWTLFKQNSRRRIGFPCIYAMIRSCHKFQTFLLPLISFVFVWFMFLNILEWRRENLDSLQTKRPNVQRVAHALVLLHVQTHLFYLSTPCNKVWNTGEIEEAKEITQVSVKQE